MSSRPMIDPSPDRLFERSPLLGAGSSRRKSQLLVVCRLRIRLGTTFTTPGRPAEDADWIVGCQAKNSAEKLAVFGDARTGDALSL